MRSVRPTFICNKSWPTLDSKRKNLLQVFRLYRIRTLSSGEFINILVSIWSISSEYFKVFIFGPLTTIYKNCAKRQANKMNDPLHLDVRHIFCFEI